MGVEPVGAAAVQSRNSIAFQELEELVRAMSRAIVDHPEEIVVDSAVSTSGFCAFEVWCREEDAGALIGKRGANASAMRTILLAAAAARRVRVSVQFLSRDGDHLPGW